MKLTTRDIGYALRDHLDDKTVPASDGEGEILTDDYAKVSHIDISDASNPLIYLENGQAFALKIDEAVKGTPPEYETQPGIVSGYISGMAETETKALFEKFARSDMLIAESSEGLSLTSRERDTVLAALRYWQREGLMSCGHEIELAENDHSNPLNASEIDDLCERINCGE